MDRAWPKTSGNRPAPSSTTRPLPLFAKNAGPQPDCVAPSIYHSNSGSSSRPNAALTMLNALFAGSLENARHTTDDSKGSTEPVPLRQNHFWPGFRLTFWGRSPYFNGRSVVKAGVPALAACVVHSPLNRPLQLLPIPVTRRVLGLSFAPCSHTTSPPRPRSEAARTTGSW